MRRLIDTEDRPIEYTKPVPGSVLLLPSVAREMVRGLKPSRFVTQRHPIGQAAEACRLPDRSPEKGNTSLAHLLAYMRAT